MIFRFTFLWFFLGFRPQFVDALVGPEIRCLDTKNEVLHIVCVIEDVGEKISLPKG